MADPGAGDGVRGAARLFVLRHGQPAYADPELLDDAVGGRLTGLGRAQAGAVADRLAGTGVDAVWSSPRGRTAETARLLAAPHGLAVRFDDRLREFDLGRWTGEPMAEHWDGILGVHRRWAAGDLSARCPGAEDGHALVARVASVLSEAVAGCPDGGVVLAVSHGGAMTVGLTRWAGHPDPGWAFAADVPEAGVVELVRTPLGWTCTSWAGQVPPG